jgi:hypothetical protein
MLYSRDFLPPPVRGERINELRKRRLYASFVAPQLAVAFTCNFFPNFLLRLAGDGGGRVCSGQGCKLRRDGELYNHVQSCTDFVQYLSLVCDCGKRSIHAYAFWIKLSPDVGSAVEWIIASGSV